VTLLDFRTDLDTRITESDLLADRADRADRAATALRSPARRSTHTISDVSVIVDGTTARLRYTTDAPVVEILVTPYRPALVDGVWVDWVLEALDGTDFALGGGTIDYFHRTLRPGIEYHFIITAPGAAGELPTQVVGTFATSRPAMAA